MSACYPYRAPLASHGVWPYVSSIYQDIPLYTSEEFLALAPEEARTEEILGDDHKAMISRLHFELTERQRCALCLFRRYVRIDQWQHRLEAKRKVLVSEKDALLKQSKSRQTTMDSVKGQIDALVKVYCPMLPVADITEVP